MITPSLTRPISVDAALADLLSDLPVMLDRELVELDRATGRVAAEDLFAMRSHPAVTVSAMDGYALAAEGDEEQGYTVVGEAAAGRAHEGSVAAGEAVRIFTGAPLPPGCDRILLQEDAVFRAGSLTGPKVPIGKHVRFAGADFSEGELLLPAGRRITGYDVALAACADHACLFVRRRPRVAIIASGDELVRPGEKRRPDQIVETNGHVVVALARAAGAEVLGVAMIGDDLDTFVRTVETARDDGADIVVTIGGASIGDHDLVKPVLSRLGADLRFSKIAMKPGKPVIHARLGSTVVLGLPGNPSSCAVVGEILLTPLVRALGGEVFEPTVEEEVAILGSALDGTGSRQEFLRAHLTFDDRSRLVAIPAADQDSSLTRVLSASDALIVRAPSAKPAKAGDLVAIRRLTA